MRQRKIKNVEEKILEFSNNMVTHPETQRGNWKDIFKNENELYLEIGCGKGNFIRGMADKYPERNFLAIEGNRSVLYKALQRGGRDNVIFIPGVVDDVTDWFSEKELSGIYLNFSDPWPKKRLAKKRLTHRDKLNKYMKVLNDKGVLEFKTDNDDLYEFSLEEVYSAGLTADYVSRDLHRGIMSEQNVMTEYEKKFSEKGKNINYFRINKGDESMEQGLFAAMHGRNIPKEDKIFGINMRAKKLISERGKDAVINGTIGALLDDEGELIVLSSINETLKTLKPKEFAEYAPIAGTPGFREAVKKAAFGEYIPKVFTEAVATPGGTGGIRNTISNYSDLGDRVLTSDWHWSPYNTIAGELGRSIDTFELFDEDRKFNVKSFESGVRKLLKDQKRLVIILNTPAHNPTGYSLTKEDWDSVIKVLNATDNDRLIALLVDVAYVDFAGDEEEYRKFLPKLEELNENILPIIGYSTSKTMTFYGFRCGAMICMTKSEAVSDEFVRVCSYSGRGSWSNCARAPQVVLEKVFADEKLLSTVTKERKEYRDMLIRRGKAFEEEAEKEGLVTVPFDAGFFISIPCDNPDEVSAKLEEKGVFIVPLAKGLRVSIASISEEKCRSLPKIIKESM